MSERERMGEAERMLGRAWRARRVAYGCHLVCAIAIGTYTGSWLLAVAVIAGLEGIYASINCATFSLIVASMDKSEASPRTDH